MLTRLRARGAEYIPAGQTQGMADARISQRARPMCRGEDHVWLGRGSISARCTMSSLHQGFQATDQPADTEAIFGWLDRMNGSPLIQQVKRQMLEVRPVGQGDHILD